MFYKHWKKVSLALTAIFWASCENTTTEPPLYGVPPQYSSSSETPESSAAAPSSSETTAESSSNREAVSSSSQSISSSRQAESSSSDFTQVMPAYGVPQMDCDVVAEHDSTVTCANGTTCTEKTVIYMNPDYVGHPCLEPQKEKDNDSIIQISQVCPDYGSIYYENKTYECNNGYTYDEWFFNKRYNSSSSTAESSSSAEVTCAPNLAGDFFSVNKTDRYTESNAQSDAKQQVKFDAYSKIKTITEDSTISKEAKACLENESDSLEYLFVAAYGSPYANRLPKELKCSDGTTRLSEEYLEQQKFDEEQAKKKPQYDAKYAEVYEEEMKKFDKKIDECQKSGER